MTVTQVGDGKTRTYGVCPYENNANRHGEKDPTGPNPRIETVEEIRHNSCGDDHRRRELETANIESIVPGRRREISVKENEVDNGGLQNIRHSLVN
jgi:hypothetical protein